VPLAFVFVNDGNDFWFVLKYFDRIFTGLAHLKQKHSFKILISMISQWVSKSMDNEDVEVRFSESIFISNKLNNTCVEVNTNKAKVRLGLFNFE
jgi:hypothetical protein